MLVEKHKNKLLYCGIAISAFAALFATDSLRIKIGAYPDDTPRTYLYLFYDPHVGCCGGLMSPYSRLEVTYPTSINFDGSATVKLSLLYNSEIRKSHTETGGRRTVPLGVSPELFAAD